MSTMDEKKDEESLMNRLGGAPAITAAVDEFYKRIIEDAELAPFFDGIDMDILKSHQAQFLKVAFTHIPKDLDVAGLMLEKHKSLFAKGLAEKHFDLVAGHFVGTLKHLGVSEELINEAVGVIAPLRPVFEQGAKEQRELEIKREETLMRRLGGAPTITAAVDEFYKRITEDANLSLFFEGVDMLVLKAHQVEFMKIAFTEIPEGLDVPGLMLKTHQRLFAIGLNEKHFDMVAGHFVGALKHLGVAEELINEAVGVIAPLRPVFEKEAKDYRQQQIEEEAEEDATLMRKLGGFPALTAAVDEFYKRITEDADLSLFFEGIDMGVLKAHQVEFMKIAFTEIPENLDVPRLMLEKHQKLFAMGLNEKHFDMVAGHFVGALKHLGVSEELVNEAVGVIAPLRPVFEQGAKDHRQKELEREETLMFRLGGPPAITAAVDEFYTRIVEDANLSIFFEGIDMGVLKAHQVEFMKIAFTEIPMDLDVAGLMLKTHRKLFAMGLNEKHFDMVAGHFVGALKHLGVSEELINEAVGVIAPLRPVFEHGAKDFRDKQGEQGMTVDF